MAELKERLVTAILDYGHSERAKNIDAEDMADYLIEVIDELHIYRKHNKGEKVIIRKDLVANQIYGGTSVEDYMMRYLGQEAIIKEFDRDCKGGYLLDIDDQYWTWTDDMFQ